VGSVSANKATAVAMVERLGASVSTFETASLAPFTVLAHRCLGVYHSEFSSSWRFACFRSCYFSLRVRFKACEPFPRLPPHTCP
jgi:hypothetical protein